MKKVFIILFIGVGYLTKAQSVFAPIGSTWNYTWASSGGGWNGPKTLFYTGDTIINLVSYKKISGAYSYGCICPNPMYGSYCCEFILERNDSVFQAYPGSTNSNQLLFSFNQPIGDSILFSQGPFWKLVLDSVKTSFICSANRRILFYTKYDNTSSFCSDTIRIIEGIGPVNDYLFSQGTHCWMGPGTYYFNCADIVTSSYPTSTCAIAVAYSIFSHQDLLNQVKLITRNEELLIAFNNQLTGELTFSDILGRNCYSEKFTNKEAIEIATVNLKSGIYFVNLKTDKGDVCKKVFIE